MMRVRQGSLETLTLRTESAVSKMDSLQSFDSADECQKGAEHV